MEKKIKEGYVVFVSQGQKKNFPQGGNHFVVHNGIPVDEFEFRAESGDYFAYLGYLIENKGPHLALEAARQANVHLKIAGMMTEGEAFFKEQIEPSLGGEIEYVGPLGYEEKIEFLQQAKAVFLPIQWEEPFGLVMIEAMACGTPVIALNRASVPEIVVDGKTGFICNSVAEMAEATKNVRKVSRADCRQHVVENFSVEKMVENYERVYEEIVEDFGNRNREHR